MGKIVYPHAQQSLQRVYPCVWHLKLPADICTEEDTHSSLDSHQKTIKNIYDYVKSHT